MVAHAHKFSLSGVRRASLKMVGLEMVENSRFLAKQCRNFIPLFLGPFTYQAIGEGSL